MSSFELDPRTGHHRIESDPDQCSRAVAIVCESVRIGDHETMLALRMSLYEAIMNAIIHGNRRQRDLPVEITWQADERGIAVEVKDCGAGFTVAAVPDPTLKENQTRIGGRGLLMIRHFMDEVSWNDRGNAIRMRIDVPI